MAARTRKTETAAEDASLEETTVEETGAATTRRRIDVDSIQVLGVEDSEEGVVRTRGRRGGLAEDHPIAVAFKDSWENGKAKTIRTDNPEDVAKLLVARANSFGLGLAKSITDDSVTFEVRERRTRTAPSGVEEREGE